MSWLLSPQGRGEEGGVSLVPATFGLSADPKPNRRRIFPEGLVLPEMLHKGHGMSDVFHLLSLILPMMCEPEILVLPQSRWGCVPLQGVSFVPPGFKARHVSFPLPRMVGAWLVPQPATRAAGHQQALEQAVPVSSS